MEKVKYYQELMAKCSYCSFCESTCPVFLEDLLETHVARSRMALINAALVDKTLPVSARLKEIVNRCLLCTNCTQTCPAKVPVDEIVVAARHEIYKGKRMNMAKRYLLNEMMQNRGIKGAMKKLVSLAKAMGNKLLPDLPEKNLGQLLSGTIPSVAEKRGKVVYYTGCVTNMLYPDTGQAVVKALTQNGFEVVMPEGLTCCGIPALGEGDIDTAREMMKNNISILADTPADAVITDCTTCGMVLREKSLKLFEKNDPIHEIILKMSSHIFEVTDFLSRQELSKKPGPLKARFTYHVPCHRNWSSTLMNAPRKLLAGIPGAEFVEMEFPEKCCGAGGAFYLEHKELSAGICDKKMMDIKATGAQIVITQCPSCRTYLEMNSDENIKIMHPIALLASAYEI